MAPHMHRLYTYTNYRLYVICMMVMFFGHEYCTSDSNYGYSDYDLDYDYYLYPAEMFSDYNEDYWIGPIPQDYIEVNEKAAKRKDFDPAKFKPNSRNNKVLVI